MTGTMIILDTNVVSELLRPQPEPRVEAWLAARGGADIYLTAISEPSCTPAWSAW